MFGGGCCAGGVVWGVSLRIGAGVVPQIAPRIAPEISPGGGIGRRAGFRCQ